MRNKILTLVCVSAVLISFSLHAQQSQNQACADYAHRMAEGEIGWGILSFLHWDYLDFVEQYYNMCTHVSSSSTLKLPPMFEEEDGF